MVAAHLLIHMADLEQKWFIWPAAQDLSYSHKGDFWIKRFGDANIFYLILIATKMLNPQMSLWYVPLDVPSAQISYLDNHTY